MSQKLPILISVPHGGSIVPTSCIDRTDLTSKDVFDDGDGLTRDIYAYQNRVVAYVDTSIARAFVDVNRRRDDVAPANPDGVIKTETTMGRPVFKEGFFPGNSLIEDLLKAHYDPYHQELDRLFSKEDIVLAFDCHSMMENAPNSSITPGKPRPLFCISNGGDTSGNPLSSETRLTCSPRLLERFAGLIRESFEIPAEEVLMNDPFKGGHIVRSHANEKVPFIQLEINRRLYLSKPDFNESDLSCNAEVIENLKEGIWKAMTCLLSSL